MATTKTELLNNGAVVATKLAAPFYSWDYNYDTLGANSFSYRRYEDDVLVYTSPTNNGTVEAAVASGFMADDFTGVQAFHSLNRKGSSAYAGAAFRVKRTAGAFEELDILFDGSGNVDQASISTFGSTGSLEVIRVYDSSGNGNDEVGGALGTNPLIYASGVLKVDDGTLYMNHENSNKILRAASIGLTSASSDFSVMGDDSANSIALGAGDTTAKFYGVATNGSATVGFSGEAGTPTYYLNGTQFTGTTRGDLATAFKGAGVKLFTALNLNLSTWSEWNTRYFSTSLFAPNKIKERVLFNIDKTAEKAAIEANINAYYTIY